MNDLPGLSALLADPVLAGILAGRRRGLLLLDYDGTLAPFTPDRDAARPYPGVADLLSRLPGRGSGRFVVVSGRRAEEIGPFLYPAVPSEVWGGHGAERLSPGGPVRVMDLAPRWRRALDRALDAARPLAPGGAIERKRVSLALHWRGLSGAESRTVRQDLAGALARIAGQAGLELLPFDGGLELRPPGLDKSLAVQGLRRECPGASLVYCGDDRTDEDAFRALGPADVGVLVRREPRPSAARYRIDPPGGLLRFLSAWAGALADVAGGAKEYA